MKAARYEDNISFTDVESQRKDWVKTLSLQMRITNCNWQLNLAHSELEKFSPDDDHEPQGITCCEMVNRKDGDSMLLLGTKTGDIHSLSTQELKLTLHLDFSRSKALLSE